MVMPNRLATDQLDGRSHFGCERIAFNRFAIKRNNSDPKHYLRKDIDTQEFGHTYGQSK